MVGMITFSCSCRVIFTGFDGITRHNLGDVPTTTVAYGIVLGECWVGLVG